MVEITKGQFITNVLTTPQNIIAFNTWLNDPMAEAVKIAWDNCFNIELDSVFVQGLVNTIVPSVISSDALDRFNTIILNGGINTTPVNPIVYTILVKALDIITVGNPWGIIKRGDSWESRVDFRNETTGYIYNEVLWFSQEERPTEQQLNDAVLSSLAKIKDRI